MTRPSIFFAVMILVIFLIWPRPAQSTKNATVDMNLAMQSAAVVINDNIASLPISAIPTPYTGFKAKQPKHHMMKIDELGKIHRFSKERVKKAKRHGSTYWLAIKILIVSCHVALLIHAFMHLTH